jgi:tripartite-type tricarboxylate transporter receptor subunit TctC
MLTQQRLCIQFLSVFLLLGVLSTANTLQAAETFPAKPIVFIIQGEPGSGGDIMMRPVVQRLSKILGKPVMIVNKHGAGGSISLKELHDAKPDGYTIGGVALTIFTDKLAGISPYDHRNFSIVSFNHVMYPVLLASSKTKRPFKTVQEAISFAKTRPGEVSMATAGVGYVLWVAAMSFQEMAGVKFNVIPQPGTTAMIATQLAGGHMDLGVSSLSPSKSQIDAGNIRFLAMCGPKRSPDYPNVPTLIEELGYDVPVRAGMLVAGPPKIPADIINKLSRAWETATSDPEYQNFVVQLGSVPMFLAPDRALKYLDEQKAIFRPIMDKAGILKEK